MEYGTLGRTGLRVSRLSLGAMTFGAGSGIWGDIAGLDRDQGTRLVAMAVERGVNLIDTGTSIRPTRSSRCTCSFGRSSRRAATSGSAP